MLRAALATAVATVALAAPAAADWSGDGAADVLAVRSDGALLLYPSTGKGAFQPNGPQVIGSGWAQFDALLTGDWTGDGKPDILARHPDGRLLLYRGNGAGGFLTGTAEQIGSGWQQFDALLLPRDWDGDGKPDILARHPDGRLLMYRGNGAGGFITGRAEQIGSGWQQFTALLVPGDWSGDRRGDILARGSDGALWLYRGDGQGGFASGRVQIGSGWAPFTALMSGGDFSGDDEPDILARAQDGRLLMYRGDGDGGFVTGSAEQVGSGWKSLGGLLFSWDPPTPAPAQPAPPPPAPPDGSVKLQAGIRCTPPGGRLKVNLKVRKRSGRKAPQVRRVVFYIRGGARKTDRKRPYVVKLRVRRPAGSRGRVYARVVFTRPGSKKLRRKTVSRRFVMCS